jgi:hypothetical protein
LTDSQIDHLELGVPVYAATSFENRVRNWFAAPQRQQAIVGLGLENDEWLEVARNVTNLVVLGSRDIGVTVHRLTEYLQLSLGQVETPTFSEALLPAGFEDLEFIAQQWASADDEDRSERIAKLSSANQKTLRDQLSRRLGDVNRYLDRLGSTPLSSAAQRLQTLGELAAELEVMTSERDKLPKR